MSDPKQALLAVAERLVAEHGVDGVSLRDIAKQAGQRNHSAVAYHFGGREGLLRALFAQRMEGINVRRAALFAEAGEDADLRTLVEVVLRPLVEHLAAAGPSSTYAQFMVRALPLLERDAAGLPSSALHREVGARMVRAMRQPEPEATRRMELALTMATSALAMFEQRAHRGAVAPGELDQLLADLVDMTVGALVATGR